MSEYYKSLITDDEVIQELIKESKKRDGKLPTEVSRIKPNLNFFQRTVSSLVSNNTRIDKSQDTFKTDYLKDSNVENSEKSDDSLHSPSKKSSIDYAFERNMVLKTKINFVQSSETLSSGGLGGRSKNKIEIKKIQFMRRPANTFKIGSGNDKIKKTNDRHNTVKQKAGAIFNGSLNDTDSESSTYESSTDLMLISNSKARKTNNISTKQDKANVRGKNKTVNKDDVICISSDEGPNQIKEKKRKLKKTKKEHSSEECRKKTKRKKSNKRKKEKLFKDK